MEEHRELFLCITRKIPLTNIGPFIDIYPLKIALRRTSIIKCSCVHFLTLRFSFPFFIWPFHHGFSLFFLTHWQVFRTRHVTSHTLPRFHLILFGALTGFLFAYFVWDVPDARDRLARGDQLHDVCEGCWEWCCHVWIMRRRRSLLGRAASRILSSWAAVVDVGILASTWFASRYAWPGP